MSAEAQAAVERASAVAGTGHWQEVRRLLVPVCDELGDLPEGLYLLGEAGSRLDDRESALAAAEAALDGFTRCGDRMGVLKTKNLLGAVLLEMGLVEAARARFEEALVLAHEVGSDKHLAHVANNLGIVADIRDEPERAITHWEAALHGYLCLGDVLGEARIHHNLGIAHRKLEQWEAAEASFTRAAERALAAGDHRLFGFAVVARGEVALCRGDLGTAERLARQALIRFDAHSTPYGHTEVCKLLGMVACARGDLDAARAHFDRAVALGEIHGAPLLDAEVRVERGRVLCLLGDTAAGLEDLQAAAAGFRTLCATHKAAGVHALIANPPAPRAPTSTATSPSPATIRTSSRAR